MAAYDFQSLMQTMPQQQVQPDAALYNGIMQAQPQGLFNPTHGQAPTQPGVGDQYAQSSPIQMRPIGNGQVQVINIRTGQVIYTGSAAGAANAQASGAAQARRIID